MQPGPSQELLEEGSCLRRGSLSLGSLGLLGSLLFSLPGRLSLQLRPTCSLPGSLTLFCQPHAGKLLTDKILRHRVPPLISGSSRGYVREPYSVCIMPMSGGMVNPA